MNPARSLALFLALVLSACGGGGGSGSSSSSSSSSSGGGTSLHFTPSRTSVSFEYVEGNSPAAERLTVTATGNFSGTLYLGATATGVAIDPLITLNVLSDTQGEFTINAAPGLAVGEYTGTISLLACSDAACTRQVGNSPLAIAYVVRVRTRLHVAPGEVRLDAVSGNSASADVNVTLPHGVTTFTATPSDMSWLSVSAPSPTTLRISARSMPVGTRTASVAVNSGPYQETVAVTYYVTPPPGGERDMRVEPATATLSAIEGTTSQPLALTVIGPTWDPGITTTFAVFPLDANPTTWLSVTPVAGGYELRGNAASFLSGTYQAQLVIMGAAPATSVTIPVTFTVGQGLIQPADIDVILDANTTPASAHLSGSVSIDVVTGSPITWTATADRHWITLTRDAGTTGSALEYSVDALALSSALANNGESLATVTVQASDPNYRAVTFRVTGHKRLARVANVVPWFQYAGRATRHVIRGTGFIAGRDWAQHLRVNGVAAGDRVTRVNDTELVLDLPPLSASETYTVIEAVNELERFNDGPNLVINAARTFEYGATPTGFRVQAMSFRDVLGHVHLVDEDAGRLVTKIRGIGATWLDDIRAIPGIRDVTPRLDGNGLIVAGTQGIAESDNALQFAPSGLPLPGMVASVRNSAVIQTNDLKTWFALEHQGALTIGYRDRVSGQHHVVSSPTIQPGEAPWFARSGNGERVFVSQGSSGNPLFAAFNAADGVSGLVPDDGTNERWLLEPSISDDGSRLVTGSHTIRDAQFASIGHVGVSHDGFISITSVVSPDARRAYVLAYEGNELQRPAPLFTPRVYVFDITTAQGAGGAMPLIGYFPIAHYPTCLADTGCFRPPKGAISGDGGTLVFAGDQRMVVIPIPAEGTLSSSRLSPRPSKARPKTTPWTIVTRS